MSELNYATRTRGTRKKDATFCATAEASPVFAVNRTRESHDWLWVKRPRFLDYSRLPTTSKERRYHLTASVRADADHIIIGENGEEQIVISPEPRTWSCPVRLNEAALAEAVAIREEEEEHMRDGREEEDDDE